MKIDLKRYYVVIKLVLIAGLLFYLAPQLFKNTIYSRNSFENIQNVLISQVEPELYPLQNNQNIRRIFGLDPAEFTQAALFRTNNALNANELLLFSFSEDSNIEGIEKALEQRLESQARIYEGYAPDAYALVENGLIDIQGNYGLFYVGQNPEQINELFLDSLKES